MKPINQILLEVTGHQSEYLQHTLIGQAEILRFAARIYYGAIEDAANRMVLGGHRDLAEALVHFANEQAKEMESVANLLPYVKKNSESA